MNNKGFTLIELLATIILLSIIVSITAASVVGLINSSKENSYEILIENIKIGAQSYFEECENSSIIGDTTINCDLNNDNNIDALSGEMSFSLGKLLMYGFLKSSSSKNGNKIIENPMNNEDIGDCEIKIIKTIDAISLSVNYSIVSISGNTICPKTEDF